MRTMCIVGLGLLVLCIAGLIRCVLWAQSQTPTLTVISQVPIQEDRVDALRYAFVEYDITFAGNAQTLHIIPLSYRVLDSYNDALRIAKRAGAQIIAVYDTVQAANALVIRLRILLLLICLALEIILGCCLWRYTRYSVLKVYQGLEQYYFGELIRRERKTLLLSAIILLSGLIIMAALWSFSAFEPVWPPQSTGKLLKDIWVIMFPPVAADSAFEKVRLAGDGLLVSGIVLTVSVFVLYMIERKRNENSTY